MQPRSTQLLCGVNVGSRWVTLLFLIVVLPAVGAMASSPEFSERTGMALSSSGSLDEGALSGAQPSQIEPSGARSNVEDRGSPGTVRKTSPLDMLKGESIVYFDVRNFQVEKNVESGADSGTGYVSNKMAPKCMLLLKDGAVQDSCITYSSPQTTHNSESLKDKGVPFMLKQMPLDRKRVLLSSRSSASVKTWFDNTPDALRQHLLQQTDVIQAIARCTIKGWETVPATSISVTRLHGALSNQLFLVEHSGACIDSAYSASPGSQRGPSQGGWDDSLSAQTPCVVKALVRVYGHQEQTAFFDAQEERRLFLDLGERGIAPKCLAEFEGGRIESYIDALPLKTSDLQRLDVLEHLVTSIADFHSVVIPRLGSPYTLLEHENTKLLASDEDLYGCTCVLCRVRSWGLMAVDAWQLAIQQTRAAREAIPASPLHKLLKEVNSVDEDKAIDVGTYLAAENSFSLHRSTLEAFDNLHLPVYLKESQWLVRKVVELSAADALYFDNFRKHLQSRFGAGIRFNEDGMPDDLLWLSGTFIVLSHNDYQENNVLRTSDGKLQLIDFEYSGMGLQAFDLGNLFCETTYDYTEADKWPFFYHLPNNMPSEDVRKDMVRKYLERMASKKALSIPTKDLVTDEVVQRAKVPEDPGSFSYLEYSKVRFAMYNKKKELLETLHGEA